MTLDATLYLGLSTANPKEPEYIDEIRKAAQAVRSLVNSHIGSYENFVTAGTNWLTASKKGAPQELLSKDEYDRGLFYTEMLQEAGFHIQEVMGDYEVAEASFLRINRSGQPLDDWETTLIEKRNSSFARAVMSVANGGAGRYWPENTNDELLNSKSRLITQASESLHRRLFVPPLKAPINDINVPFLAASKFFPKHAYLMELFPVVMRKDDINELFLRDKESEPATVIHNGYELIQRTNEVFDHLTGVNDNPLSLSLVPLFYFYTNIGRYVRSSLYGFITWIMSGSEEEIRARKIIFSVHRGRFEEVLYTQDLAGAISRRTGSGLRSVGATVQFYQKLLELLINDSSAIEDKAFHTKLVKVMSELTTPNKKQAENTGRLFTSTQKTKINMREIYKSSIRCGICGGILDLRMGKQYDHIEPFANNRITNDENGRPTHPFCNNNEKTISKYRSGSVVLKLPTITQTLITTNEQQLDMFKDTIFPDERL